MVTVTKVDLHVDLEPDALPISVVYPIRTHTLRVIDGTLTSGRFVTCWRLAIRLVSDVDATGEPWTYRVTYTLEEATDHDKPQSGDWIIRYQYARHDHALARLEQIASQYLERP